jgi:3-isopropylmalate/(R)-2-methylmalate dehydratase large subunit
MSDLWLVHYDQVPPNLLIHEVTSPQAFEGLAMAGRKPWRLQANLAVPDHNVPTTNRSSITDSQ